MTVSVIGSKMSRQLPDAAMIALLQREKESACTAIYDATVNVLKRFWLALTGYQPAWLLLCGI